MKQPVSVFFMDVRESSRFSPARDLEAYMNQTVERLERWTSGIVHMDAIYRRGDEIVLVAEHFATAYLLAYYIRAVWEYPDHPPYFGLSYGLVDDWSPDVQLETWVHPMFKAARNAVNQLKLPGHRPWNSMHFESSASEFAFPVRQINQWLWVEREWSHTQSLHQREAMAMYSVHGSQTKVADLLGKDRSTISRILSRGHAGNLLEVSKIIEALLHHDECHSEEEWPADIRNALRSRVAGTDRI